MSQFGLVFHGVLEKCVSVGSVWPILFTEPTMVDLEELYGRSYYLSDCEGFQEFCKTWGRKPSRRLRKCVKLLRPSPGQRIADLVGGSSFPRSSLLLAREDRFPSPEILCLKTFESEILVQRDLVTSR